MRLHNRQIKATFWNDPDLLQMSRDKRWFYEGLTQLADDSACLEDSPFAFKLHLFPSPLDADITVEVITEWRNEMVEIGKLIPYEAGNKKCLYILNFPKHQTLKNPDKPEVPLPEWIKWEPYPSNPRTGKFIFDYDLLNNFLQSSYASLTNIFQPEPEPEPEPELEEEPEPEREENNVVPYRDIVDYLNQKCNKNFKHSTKSTRNHINARWQEGYRLEDFKTVVNNKSSTWLGTDMDKYLRPETLFSPKFESYLNEKPDVRPPTKQNIPRAFQSIQNAIERSNTT